MQTIERNAGYDVIIAKIEELPVNEALSKFGADAKTRLRNARLARQHRAFVEGALDSMSFDEFRSFHEYRKAVIA